MVVTLIVTVMKVMQGHQNDGSGIENAYFSRFDYRECDRMMMCVHADRMQIVNDR